MSAGCAHPVQAMDGRRHGIQNQEKRAHPVQAMDGRRHGIP